MTSVQSLSRLEGRVALVTGAAGRIGRAACETLGEMGADVIATDIDAGGLADTVAKTMEFGQTRTILANLEQEQEVRSLASWVKDELGRLDVLVHAAALVGTSDLPGWTVPFESQTLGTWQHAIEVDLTAAFVLTQSCAGLLADSGAGSIINIASIYGSLGPDLRLYDDTEMGNPAAYAAAKGGLVQFSRWLATVLAPQVRVNTISPGGIFSGQVSTFVTRYEARTPLGRMANVDDMRGAIAYLASDLSAYVTGIDLKVDGGWSAW
jgi:NAD(P)-dependent dehydrogenase (short-subunit alcohol dehydrogenase family)